MSFGPSICEQMGHNFVCHLYYNACTVCGEPETAENSQENAILWQNTFENDEK